MPAGPQTQLAFSVGADATSFSDVAAGVNGLHLDHRVLTVTHVDYQVHATIVCKGPVDLIPEESDSTGEEEFARRAQAEVAWRPPAQLGPLCGIGFVVHI